MLGHSDPRTTMRYAHLGQAFLLAAAETVSGFFTASGGNGGKNMFFPPSGGMPFTQGRSRPCER